MPHFRDLVRDRRKVLVASAAALLMVSGVGVASAAVPTNAALKVSTKADRSSAIALGGSSLKGTAYIFLDRDRAGEVSFYLDDASRTNPIAVERLVPYDLGTTAPDGTARGLNTTGLADGSHTVSAVYKTSSRTRTFTARFTVANTSNPTTTTTSTTRPSTSTSTSTTSTSTPSTTTAPTTTSTTRPSTTVAPTTSTTRPATTTTTAAPTTGKPGATNTGVPAGTQLTVVNGNQTYTTAGQVISGLDIRGKVVIRGNNITLKNSIVRGPSGTSCVNGAALEVEGSGNVVENVEVAVSNPTACLDGVNASNATLTRLNVHGGVDGLKLDDNAKLSASWVHDLKWFASDPNQGGGETHNDSVQILSGSNIVLDGNNLDARGEGTNAAVQVTQDFGLVNNLNITKNWMDGGGCSLNVAHKGGSSLTVTASGNKFGHSSFYGCPILLSTKTTLNGTGNVYEDTGAVVPIQRHD